MSYANGPRIVTDGLIMYLDAANSKSYPGSGTTWYDLSGNGNNGTITGGSMSHSFSINRGVMIFPKISGNYINISLNLSTTNHTIIGASRYVSVNTGTSHGGGRIISGLSNNWLLGHWERSSKKHFANGWVSSSSGTQYNGDLSWNIYTSLGNYSSDRWSFYANDTLIVNQSTGGANGPNGFSLGRYAPGNSEYSNSHVGFLMAYNRVLTDAEVKQNYNALKGRYGLT